MGINENKLTLVQFTDFVMNAINEYSIWKARGYAKAEMMLLLKVSVKIKILGISLK